MHRGDGGLQLVRPGPVPAERGGDERDAFADERMVPSASVLLVERDEFAVRTGASGAPRLGEEQQAEEAGNLGFVGSEGVRHACEANGLDREVRPAELRSPRGDMALVEHEVEHVQDAA